MAHPPSLQRLNQVFQPHPIADGEELHLFHVYDEWSQTPYVPGEGVWCADPDRYYVNAWHIIPQKIRDHLDWKNRNPTQFVSFFGSAQSAITEAQRRRRDGRRRSVRIVEIALPSTSKVWVFSRPELLAMMQLVGSHDVQRLVHPDEWFVWVGVPDNFVVFDTGNF